MLTTVLLARSGASPAHPPSTSEASATRAWRRPGPTGRSGRAVDGAGCPEWSGGRRGSLRVYVILVTSGEGGVEPVISGGRVHREGGTSPVVRVVVMAAVPGGNPNVPTFPRAGGEVRGRHARAGIDQGRRSVGRGDDGRGMTVKEMRIEGVDRGNADREDADREGVDREGVDREDVDRGRRPTKRGGRRAWSRGGRVYGRVRGVAVRASGAPVGLGGRRTGYARAGDVGRGRRGRFRAAVVRRAHRRTGARVPPGIRTRRGARCGTRPGPRFGTTVRTSC